MKLTYRQKHDAILIILCIIVSMGCSIITNALFNNGVNQSQSVNISINEPTERLINLNTATAEELKTLPGIGEALSTQIIENRPYNDIWQIAEIKGVGPDTVKAILPYVTV